MLPWYGLRAKLCYSAGRAGKIGRPERIAQWMDLLIRMNREIRRGDVATVTAAAAGLRALR